MTASSNNRYHEPIPVHGSPEWERIIDDRKRWGPRAMRALFAPGGQLARNR